MQDRSPSTSRVSPGRAPQEEILDPDLPIVDAHHHLWFQSEPALRALEQAQAPIARALAPTYRRHARYLLEDYLADARQGHKVEASVFVDARLMYRADGPEHLRSVGEVEFVNGVAAMSASGNFGDARICAGIVGRVDFTLGERAEDILLAHLSAGGKRYKGARCHVAFDEDPAICPPGTARPDLLLDPAFRMGFGRLERFGLSFDAFVFEPQLPQLVDLARAFPATSIVLEHLGTPLGIGRYAGSRTERFAPWRGSMQALAECPNVSLKLGGLGMPFAGFDYDAAASPVTSEGLAEIWRPYIETAIEAFGPERCMFESNFPIESGCCDFTTLWNAFKRVTQGASAEEKHALYGATATRVYRLSLRERAGLTHRLSALPHGERS